MHFEKQFHSREALEEAIRTKLTYLYGKENTPAVFEQIRKLLSSFPETLSKHPLALSEKDAILIAYGDHIKRPSEAPLATLREIMQQLSLPVSVLHILPFYPYSSDDGFSVIDYYAVDPALGDWKEIRAFRENFRLMFDGVINHISSQSAWFQGFLRGEDKYRDYFIVTDPRLDLSSVTRPRTLPLLSAYETTEGLKHVWTTFSEDQIDLNFANPDVLLEIIRLLLFYIEQGAGLIRLDAIAFLWKEIGTSCIHLPQTHSIIQLIRDVLDIAAPETILITETNVPHIENISYFGNGYNETQMVYQFPLPPLILHTLSTGSAKQLSHWAKGIQRQSERSTFFNFTASHDGIGLRPVTGILNEIEINALVERVQKHGGYVSYRSQPDGTKSPYELNINYFDAITDPAITAKDEATAIARFMVSQAIMLAFIGVPGIYFHSIFGSRNDTAGVAATGRYRSINREKLDAETLLSELNKPESLRAKVFTQYCKLLETRAEESAFHPLGNQTVLDLDSRVFALERMAADGKSRILALNNVSGDSVSITLPEDKWRDLVTDTDISSSELVLSPHQVLWLKPRSI